MRVLVKNSIPYVLFAAFLLAAFQTHAASDYYLKVGDIKGESEAKSEAGVSASAQAEGEATTSTGGGDADKPVGQGNVAPAGEKGNSADKASPQLMQSTSKGQSGDEDSADVQGAERYECPPERPACPAGESALCRRGVWYCREDASRSVQYNETDLEFLKGNAVSVSAIEVRGWDAKQKAEFMAAVKTHAQVRSGQDLENFAKGILVSDENVEEISSDEDGVEIRYRVPAKFLGFLDTSLPATIVAEKSAGQGESKGTVKVKFPWFRLFYAVPDVVSDASLETELQSELSPELGAAVNDARTHASLYAKIVAILKARADSSGEEVETE